jgi:glycosyltransferase involved in cell wall biosynthesis
MRNAMSKLHVLEVHHHTFAYGHTHALAEYLRGSVLSFMYIQHPFAHRRYYPSTVDLYVLGNLVKRIIAPSIRAPEILLFIKDLLLTIIFTLRMRCRFQIFIGADALNALAGIFLRKLGFTRFVVLFAIDYTPKRFSSTTMNFLYHKLNSFVARHCDLIWAVSKRIRQAYLQVYGARCPIIIVPAGAKRPPMTSDVKISHNRLVFVGNLDKSKGLQLAIQALPEIKRKIPEVELIVIGTGPYYNDLKKMSEELMVDNSVKFIGHVQNHQDIMRILTQCDIGLAPYVPDMTNVSMYGFPLKVIEYLTSGLPVILTNVPEFAAQISKMQAGIIIDYDVKNMADAVIRLLSDRHLLETYKKNAIKLGQEYSWDKIFSKTLTETIKALKDGGST